MAKSLSSQENDHLEQVERITNISNQLNSLLT
jgi:hypothetical protein